mgnify:CR=1 FL=1
MHALAENGVLMSSLARSVFYLLVSSVITMSAAADDNSAGSRIAYSTAACQPIIPAESAFLVYNPSGVFVSGDTQNVTVHCPIARTKTNSRRGARVDVVVFKRGTFDLAVHCALYSLSSDGSAVVDSDEQPASLGHAASAVIELRVENIERDGFFTLACLLPRDHGMAQYVVQER